MLSSCEVGGHAVFFESNVLEKRTEANGLVNFGLSFRAEVDGFGIASALHVEHPLCGPAVLVVPNQRAVGVAAQRGLSRA